MLIFSDSLHRASFVKYFVGIIRRPFIGACVQRHPHTHACDELCKMYKNVLFCDLFVFVYINLENKVN